MRVETKGKGKIKSLRELLRMILPRTRVNRGKNFALYDAGKQTADSARRQLFECSHFARYNQPFPRNIHLARPGPSWERTAGADLVVIVRGVD